MNFNRSLDNRCSDINEITTDEKSTKIFHLNPKRYIMLELMHVYL